MIDTLRKNWWLLALCGVLDAIVSAVFLIMRGTDGPLTSLAWKGTVVFLGNLALAAGACSIAAGVWRSAKGKCWPLVLNGLALGALGLTCTSLTRFSISFRTISLLIVVMALSMGIAAVVTTRTLRWFPGLAGAGSGGFALAFLALAFGWIRPEPGSHSDLLWLGAYFGFSALCFLGLAQFLVRTGRTSRPG